MAARSFMLEWNFNGSNLDTSAATYTMSFGPGGTGLVHNLTEWTLSGPQSAYGLGAENDAPTVDSVRLLCNFADGMVWKPGNNASFGLWQGASSTVEDAPSSLIVYAPKTLNEWTPVNMPLPRDPETVQIYGGCAALAFGNLAFNIAGISDDFNGAEVYFTLQILLKTALW